VTLAEKFEARGEARGVARSEARWRSEILLELLQAKFKSVPAEVVNTVRAADVAQVRAWIVRVLTADTLEDIFG